MTTEPLLELGNDVELEENQNGEPVLRHKPSGAEFKYDSTDDAWKPKATLNMAGNDIEDVGSLKSNFVNNEVYVQNYDGPGLASRLENALDDLKNNFGGQGRVRITPKSDGTIWRWDKNLTLDPSAYNGIHIDADETVHVKYDDSGWMMTVNSSETAYNHISKGHTFKLTGGIWEATSSPKGAFKIVDTNWAIIKPNLVKGFFNRSNDGTAFRIENIDEFCEDTHIQNVSVHDCDYGIDFVPASVTGGNGTESFQQTYVSGCVFRQVRNIGIRVRGRVQYSTFNNLVIFPGASGFTGMLRDGNMEGTIISMLEIENAERVSNTTGLKWNGSNAGGPQPLVLNYNPVNIDTEKLGDAATIDGEDGHTRIAGDNLQVEKYETEVKIIDTWDGSPTGPKVLFNKADADQWYVQGDDGAFNVNDVVNDNSRFTITRNGPIDVYDGPIAFSPRDVRSISSPSRGWTAYHDGSGSNPEGPAFYDGSKWISQIDGTTIN